MTVQETCAARKTARHRRWSAVVLAASVLLVPACTGANEHRATPSMSEPTVTAGPAVAFDPPSRFDLARAVPLTEEQVVHGTLYGTTSLWVEDGTVHLVDLADPGRSWAVELPADRPRDFLNPPLVVGNVVVVASGGDNTARHDEVAGDYIIAVVGMSLDDGSTLWNLSFPVRLDDRALLRNPDYYWQCFGIAEHDGNILMMVWDIASVVALIDPAAGSTRWRSESMVALRPSGRYAIVVSDAFYENVGSLDLDTGQVVALGNQSSELTSAYVDPVDPTGIVIKLQESRSSKASLRFSSADGTIQAFTPDPNDIRYSNDYSCRSYDMQPVLVCQTVSFPRSLVGVDPATGEVVWTLEGEEGLDDPIAFHGHLYGGRLYQYAVVDQRTGKTVTPDIGFGQDRDNPIKVNEYGAMGIVSRPDDPLNGRYAWAPASG